MIGDKYTNPIEQLALSNPGIVLLDGYLICIDSSFYSVFICETSETFKLKLKQRIAIRTWIIDL